MERVPSFAMILCLFLVCVACTAGKMMTQPDYEAVPLGQGTKELVLRFGEPVERRLRSDHEEYVYIERIPLGSREELMREYLFVIASDRVVDKRKYEVKSDSLRFSVE